MYSYIAVLQVHDWTALDVSAWLDSIGLGDYKQQFASPDIQGPELLTLGRTDLQVRLNLRSSVTTSRNRSC